MLLMPAYEGKRFPEKEKKCNQCRKIGHFGSCCKGSQSTQKKYEETKSLET